MVKLTVAGNWLTAAGLTLQLFAPNVFAQSTVTTPLKPSCAVMVMGPVVPVLPSVTVGKGVGSLKTKSGLVVTRMLKVTLTGAGAPGEVAINVAV